MTDTTDWQQAAGQVAIGDKQVARFGLGTNRITDNEESHKLLQFAVEQGITFIDTAHVYSDGASEIGIGNALAPYKEGVIIATKGGIGSQAEGPKPNGSEAALREQVAMSLEKLKLAKINLYQLHRVDPNIPFTETLQALKTLHEEGMIDQIGLSEVTIEQLEQARVMLPVASVQNRYSVADRQHDDVLEYCTTHGIVFIPWAPLGGFYDDRAAAVSKLATEMARNYGVTVQQLAIAWLLKRSPSMLPIPGTLSTNHLLENLAAAKINLSTIDYQELFEAVN